MDPLRLPASINNRFNGDASAATGIDTSRISDSDIIIIGVCDESRSHAKRKGASKGPDALRSAFNRYSFFERNGKLIPILPMEGMVEDKKIFDLGNVTREDLYGLVFDIASKNKIPVIIGGDHSITTIVLDAIGNACGQMGLVYFDAHPDFVSSTTNYYGSVLYDSARWINFDRSMLVGTRSAEPEEIDNATKAGLGLLSSLDVAEMGVSRVSDMIVSKTCSKKYISIDLDCIDPAFAPGVSVPSSGGLSNIDLIYILKKVIRSGIIGMDIVELCPDYDINDMTSHLASRILLESLASIKINLNVKG